MILMIIFVLIGFAFIGWSFYENMKSKKGTAQEFIKAEVINVQEFNQRYTITVAYQQNEEWYESIFDFHIAFPVGSFIDVTIDNNNKITLYSKPIRYSEIFRVLTRVEKWRYAGLTSFALGALCALVQSGKATPIIIGLMRSAVAAVCLFIAMKSQRNLKQFIDQETQNNIDFIDGHVIGRTDKTAFVAYQNNFNQTFTVTIPNKHAKDNDIQIMHHVPSDTLIHVSKKNLKIQNIVCLCMSALIGIATLALFIWFKSNGG